MERRSVLTSIGVGLLGQVPFIRPAHAEPASPAPSPPPALSSEYEPFRKIAKAKGVQIFVNQPPPATAAAVSALHLDMNMVRASIENAIERTKQKPELNKKLRRLLSNGTPVQQVEFVHGSGRYYFPEDIDKAIAQSQSAASAASAASDAQCWVCENVCTLVCHCLGNGDQYCQDKCKDVCHKYC